MPLYTGKWLKQHLSYMYVLACTHQILFYLDGGRKVRKQRLLVPHIDRKHQPSEKERNQRRSWEEGDWELTLFCNKRKELGSLEDIRKAGVWNTNLIGLIYLQLKRGWGRNKKISHIHFLMHVQLRSSAAELYEAHQHCLVWLFPHWLNVVSTYCV